jgi:hypothetical protein
VWFLAWDRAVTQVNGIAVWVDGIREELAKRLPRQRKTQRDKLAVLVATMLHVRSANLVELAAGLPRESDRWDMGYQWISRFLANDLVCCDEVMEPFAREILARLGERGEPIPLILDQTKASDRHQILMLSVRWGALRQAQERLAPGLAGRRDRGRHRLYHAEGAARRGCRLAARGSGRDPARRPLLRNPGDDPLVSRMGMGLSPAAQEQSHRLLGRDKDHDQRARLVRRPLLRERRPDRQAGHHQYWHHPRPWA